MKVVMIRLTLIVGKSLPIEVCQIVFGVDTLVNSMHAASVSILDGSDSYLNQIHTLIQELKNELGEIFGSTCGVKRREGNEQSELWFI